MNVISLKDFNLGGIADSKFQGRPNSVAELVGFDIHSEPGILKNNQRLVEESVTGGAPVTEEISKILPCSNGKTYFFGKTTGQIWVRTSAGAYNTIFGSGIGAILDAWEYQGYIYYAFAAKLGRVPVAATIDWAGSRDDAFGSFTNSDALFHPMRETNGVLYIGDGKDLAQVDAGVFSASALDLSLPYRIKCLGRYLTDILLGTYINTYTILTSVFRWNTWSSSFSSQDDIPEVGVNAFLRSDNIVLANIGTKGHFYQYDGLYMEFKEAVKIPGSYGVNKQALVYPNACCNLYGLPLFGLSNGSDNPATEGIYSIGGYDSRYPNVLNLEWTISTGFTTGVVISAMEIIPTTEGARLAVAWSRTNGSTWTYGVDIVDPSNQVTQAYFATRVINMARGQIKNLRGHVSYRKLPSGASIKIYYKENYASSWTEFTDTVVDADRKIVAMNSSFPNANVLEIKVESNCASGNNAPEIDGAEFYFD